MAKMGYTLEGGGNSMKQSDSLQQTVHALAVGLKETYSIPETYYTDQRVKLGLRNTDGTGVAIGVSKIGSVQGYFMREGHRVPQPGKLYYHGISVEDIVEAHRAAGSFGYEEVAYLLLLGVLPTQAQLDCFRSVLTQARRMPAGFTEDFLLRAPSPDIMVQLARSVLALYSYDQTPNDLSAENLLRQSIELVSRFPLIAANAYAAKRHYFEGKSLYLHNPSPDLSVAENILRMIRPDKTYSPEEAHLLDLVMILHAEHSSNNSTFVCRAMTSSGTDTYSAIAGAVGSLKGPLHGGASGKVMQMFRDVREHVGLDPSDAALDDYLEKILDGAANDGSGKIYGLGHAVYTLSDPRAVILRRYASELATEPEYQDEFALLQRIETRGIARILARKHDDMPLCANVDLYSGMVYRMLGIPEDMYTPLFACARISGWCAHRLEEVLTCGRIMRPAYRTALTETPYVPIESR